MFKGIWISLLTVANLAFGGFKLINLGDQTVFVASQSYSNGSSSISAGDYNLPAVSPAGWTYRGWWAIEPGGAFSGDSNLFYYAAINGNALNWTGLPTSNGLIKSGPPFTVFWAKGQSATPLINQGYKGATFLKFNDNTHYRVSGSAFRVAEQTFTFDNESRSIQFLTNRFSVNGKIFDYSLSASERYAKSIQWHMNGNTIALSGSIEGRQTSPFAARTPGVYSGKVTVYYTTR